MEKKLYVEDDQLHYDAYWEMTKGHFILREALPHDHPQQLYNYLKENSIIPEDFGIFDYKHQLLQEKYNFLTREQLLEKVIELELQVKQLENYF